MTTLHHTVKLLNNCVNSLLYLKGDFSSDRKIYVRGLSNFVAREAFKWHADVIITETCTVEILRIGEFGVQDRGVKHAMGLSHGGPIPVHRNFNVPY